MGRCEYCSRPTAKNKENVSFHRFPTNSAKSAIWVKNMGRIHWKPRKDSVLCSTHFTKDCFDRMTRMRLVKGSVPTIFHPLSKLILMNEETLQQMQDKADPLYIEPSVQLADYQNGCSDSSGPSIMAQMMLKHQSEPPQSTYANVIHDHHYAAVPLPRGRRKSSCASSILPLIGKSKKVLMQRARRFQKITNLQKRVNPLEFGCIDGLYNS